MTVMPFVVCGMIAASLQTEGARSRHWREGAPDALQVLRGRQPAAAAEQPDEAGGAAVAGRRPPRRSGRCSRAELPALLPHRPQARLQYFAYRV